MKKKLRHPQFLALHAGIVLAILLLPLYLRLSAWASGFLGNCILHRVFLYCPLCGGTRAIASLVSLDFAGAWQSNAFVVLLCIAVLMLDVCAWVRYFQKKTPLLPLPRWSGIVLTCIIVFYFLLRNYLMIFHGIDPLGDLGYFWDAVRAVRS